MVAIAALLLGIMIFFSSPVSAANFGAKYCKLPEFTCHITKKGDSWKKLFPVESERDLVMRINRMNTHLRPGIKLAIPNDLSAHYLDFAPFPKQISSSGKREIKVSLSDLAFGAYDENGTLQHWGPVSGGKDYCADVGRGCRTKVGNYAIYHKKGASCVSSKFPVGKGGAPMPYCMFYHDGFALHGSYDVPGYNASHGCVRMFIDDAKWLNQEFSSGIHTKVAVNR